MMPTTAADVRYELQAVEAHAERVRALLARIEGHRDRLIEALCDDPEPSAVELFTADCAS